METLERVFWDHTRDRLVGPPGGPLTISKSRPRFMSEVPTDTDITNAEIGIRMLGLTLFPQGRDVAAVMEAKSTEIDMLTGRPAPLYAHCTVQEPRRSSKTTAIQAVYLGRCETIPGHRVVQTAQDGTRASGFFMNMVRMLERVTPEPADRNWKVYKSTGREYLEWSNGSRWWVVPPDPAAFRGEAADDIWFDEGGEFKPETAKELRNGVLALMDTRSDAQITISGTPGIVRAGMFWEDLEAARKDPNALGIVDYSAADNDLLVLPDGTPNEDLWWLRHPGLACGLTTIKKMRERWEKLGPVGFGQEYLCIWSSDNTISALDPVQWVDTTTEPVPFAGQDFDLTFDCHIQGAFSAIVATWLDDAGEVHAQVMDYRPGIDWVAAELARANRAHPKVKINYDAIGNNSAVAMSLQRIPGFKINALRPVTMRDAAAGAALVSSGLANGTWHHALSPALDTAAQNVTWRYSGESRLFGRKSANVCVAAVVAASIGTAMTTGRRRRKTGSLPAPIFGNDVPVPDVPVPTSGDPFPDGFGSPDDPVPNEAVSVTPANRLRQLVAAGRI